MLLRTARTTFEDLLDTVLPPRCPGCGRAGEVVCAACRHELASPPPAPPPAPILWWTACFAYEGVARELVARAKYRNERRFLGAVGRELALVLESAPVAFDVITWAPASAPRVRAQGVDHGELLARSVARHTGVAVASCLARAAGPPQTGLRARARRLGPTLVATGAVTGATILVVDDVATTGGTLAAAGRALEAAGSGAVLAATIARTPGPGGRSGAHTYTPPTPAGLRSL